jgi:hypothetical protein
MVYFLAFSGKEGPHFDSSFLTAKIYQTAIKKLQFRNRNRRGGEKK